MRLCVVDCSFAMAWVFADEKNPAADALLRRLEQGDTIVVPAVLWGLEVRNTLRSSVLRKRMTAAQADERRLALLDLPRISVTCPAGLGDVLDRLIRAYALTSYDAVYLAVAIEHGLPLATSDEALADAAERAGVAKYASA